MFIISHLKQPMHFVIYSLNAHNTKNAELQVLRANEMFAYLNDPHER